MYTVEMNKITKTFNNGKVIANENVDLKVKNNTIHTIIGENGAGKSTLMSVLFGLYKPDSGTIKINGNESKINSPLDANKVGIGMVHQHFKLVKNFTVLENIMLGAEIVDGIKLNYSGARKKALELSDQYKLNIDPDAITQDISVGSQQRVEIMKLLWRGAEIIILDEPTAVLTPQEINEFLDIIKGFKKQGKTVIIITHKLEEIKAVADEYTIIRRGKYISSGDVKTKSISELAALMVGKSVDFKVVKKPSKPKDIKLEVKDLESGIRLKGVSFNVKAGEIVAIAGVEGSGQSRLFKSILNTRPYKGQVFMNGKNVDNLNTQKRLAEGVANIIEDRQQSGLWMDGTIYENILMANQYNKKYIDDKTFIDFEKLKKDTSDIVKHFDVRNAEDVNSSARSLSGGNQQKLIFGRELTYSKNIILAFTPTRGLDVSAISYLNKELIKARDNGAAILLVSYELDQVLNLADRILVFNAGVITAELNPKNTSKEDIGVYMASSGGKKHE